MKRLKDALQRAQRDRANKSGDEPNESRNGEFAQRPQKIRTQLTRIIDVHSARLESKRVVAETEQHPAAIAYKILRTQVLRRMKANGWNAIAITSPAPDEGKTLTSVNLAISMAKQFSVNVLLVDLDLRKPSISDYFDEKPAFGLADYLLSNLPLQDILFSPGIDHLVVLPSKPSAANASELLGSPKMFDLVNELKTKYPDRFILFDLPPLLLGDEALSFLPCVDCVLLVIADGKSAPDEIKRAANLLENTHLIGSVLNYSADSATHRYYQHY